MSDQFHHHFGHVHSEQLYHTSILLADIISEGFKGAKGTNPLWTHIAADYQV